MTIEAQRSERDHAEHNHRDKLIDRVMRAIGPAYDGAAELQNRAFAGRLITALLALRVIHEHADKEQHNQHEDTASSAAAKRDKDAAVPHHSPPKGTR
jgi:hypothetical protein